MRMVKGLLLGSAAGLFAVGGAQAADLPVKAKPVEYVKVCSLYGVGYYYIPGTQTCIKIGGYLRAEINFNATGSHTTPVNGPNVQYVRTADTSAWRVRSSTTFDIRSQTEYGTLRTYADIWFTHDAGSLNTTAPSLNRGFIQFAGFTFGRVTTAAATPWAGLPGTSAGRLMGADDIVVTQGIQYTAAFGNGVTATVALENAPYRGPGQIYDRADAINAPTATAFTSFSNGGFHFPNIVGNVNVTQSWGTLFLSALASQKFPSYYGATEDTGSPGSEWGYALTAGLNLKLDSLGAGDQMWIEGTWTRGVLGRLQGAAGFQTYGVYGSSSAGYQSLAFGYALDAVFNSAPGFQSDLELTTGWGFAAGIEHFWVPGRLRSSLFGSYSSVNYSDTANAWLCSKYGFASTGAAASVTNGAIVATPGVVAAAAGTGGCDFDFSTWQIGSRTIWTPVAGLDFTGEVLYTNIDQNHSGFLNTIGTAVGIKPQGNYELKDQGIVTGLLRVQRNW